MIARFKEIADARKDEVAKLIVADSRLNVTAAKSDEWIPIRPGTTGALALALMLPFTWAALARQPRRWLAEWRQLLVLGGLGMWICGAFVYIGGQTTSALNIGLIYAACPVAIAVAGLWLLHERMSMAQRAGADVIVTACPFCLVNIEDAIKVAGLEGKMEAIDLCELIDRHLRRDT